MSGPSTNCAVFFVSASLPLEEEAWGGVQQRRHHPPQERHEVTDSDQNGRWQAPHQVTDQEQNEVMSCQEAEDLGGHVLHRTDPMNPMAREFDNPTCRWVKNHVENGVTQLLAFR
jgi:hypothetical protein